MNNIRPEQLLEQIEMGAEVVPGSTEFGIGVKVGRHIYECDLEDFNKDQKIKLERLYRAIGEDGKPTMLFSYPGDFIVKPFFFRGELRSSVVTPGAGGQPGLIAPSPNVWAVMVERPVEDWPKEAA